MTRLAVVFLLATCCLAAFGMGYAHWSKELAIDGAVMTGSIGACWTEVETWDSEPSEKDVSHIDCSVDGGDCSVLHVEVVNAYPSVYYHSDLEIQNTGTIPLHIYGITVDNPHTWLDVDVTGLDGVGTPGGSIQLHPGESLPVGVHVHLTNDAPPGATAGFDLIVNTIQYNEDPFAEAGCCAIGQIALHEGYDIGFVNVWTGDNEEPGEDVGVTAVAAVTDTSGDGDDDLVAVSIENGYRGYEGCIHFDLHNYGSKPLGLYCETAEPAGGVIQCCVTGLVDYLLPGQTASCAVSAIVASEAVGSFSFRIDIYCLEYVVGASSVIVTEGVDVEFRGLMVRDNEQPWDPEGPPDLGFTEAREYDSSGDGDADGLNVHVCGYVGYEGFIDFDLHNHGAVPIEVSDISIITGLGTDVSLTGLAIGDVVYPGASVPCTVSAGLTRLAGVYPYASFTTQIGCAEVQ